MPPTLHFRDTKGAYFLGECRDMGGTVSTLGASLTRIRAGRAIEAGGSEADYSQVDGMSSEIDGLSSWSGMSTVTQTTDTKTWVNLRAEHQESIQIGGKADVAIESSFMWNPSPKGNVFGITDLAILRTRSNTLWSWQDHGAVHHMFQDLMCLVFGRPCLSRVTSVKREDDQPHSSEGDTRGLWREVYEPTFGRSVEGVEPLDRAKARPLFYLKDVDSDALTSWIDQWKRWSRPTWIAVTTMFQRGTTVESKLLQIGVALEALGYALWKESGPPATPTPSYPALLEWVTDAVGVEHPGIYGARSVAQWRREFNETFKGTKHADKPLPDGNVAHGFAGQGMNLVRGWLGTRLGVSEETLKEGFDRR